MSEVKRYNPELEKDIGLGLPCLSMLGNPYGEWVHYQDYAELKAQRDALAAKGIELCREAAHVYQKYNVTQMPDMDLVDCQTIQEFSDLAAQIRAGEQS